MWFKNTYSPVTCSVTYFIEYIWFAAILLASFIRFFYRPFLPTLTYKPGPAQIFLLFFTDVRSDTSFLNCFWLSESGIINKKLIFFKRTIFCLKQPPQFLIY